MTDPIEKAATAGKIDCYLDFVSFYSYIVFLDLIENREALASHSVEVEFHPVFLGGIVQASGNKPPWTVPAKAIYGNYDSVRTIARFPGLAISMPQDLMASSLSVVANRALHSIKLTHPSKFEPTLHYLLYRFYTAPNLDLSRPPNVIQALSEIPSTFRGYLDGPIPASVPKPITAQNSSSQPLFTPDEIKAIMQSASTPEMKDRLTSKTKEALDQGAFGAPWLWVTNSRGEGEPFFGSDRFHFVYKFLGLPIQELAILPARGDNSKL